MNLQYKFTDTELKKILAENMVIIVDTREQQNRHILDYFDKENIKYITKKLDSGDYSIKINANTELGFLRDIYLPIAIEKKNSVDELASSFKDRSRFEAEFIRAKGNNTKIVMLVEEANGFENITKGNYRSQYDSKAFLASLATWEHRYNFSTVFLDKVLSGRFIYNTLKYFLYEQLKE